MDTKKKELVCDFKNAGREWELKDQPEEVRVHDFEIREPDKGKVAPYGVDDLGQNVGWVSVGVDHDTAAFAVESIRRWSRWMGTRSYPRAKRLLITADAGGSNGARVRLWKWELQKLADEIGLEISASHFPPGTSKWNKIERRPFSFMSQSWRAKPRNGLGRFFKKDWRTGGLNNAPTLFARFDCCLKTERRKRWRRTLWPIETRR
jgi:hypothetical protein